MVPISRGVMALRLMPMTDAAATPAPELTLIVTLVLAELDICGRGGPRRGGVKGNRLAREMHLHEVGHIFGAVSSVCRDRAGVAESDT